MTDQQMDAMHPLIRNEDRMIVDGLHAERASPMDEDETTFPMDVTDEDPSSRPWNFRPEGYLVVIVADIEEARQAERALVQAGFAPKDIKLYTGKQILENQVVYIGRRSITSKLVAAVAEDVEGRELYLAYAREDRGAMWVRLRDGGRAAKALRVLADFDCLHARYYGDDEEHDFHIS
jgi:hypothetical protein